MLYAIGTHLRHDGLGCACSCHVNQAGYQHSPEATRSG